MRKMMKTKIKIVMKKIDFSIKNYIEMKKTTAMIKESIHQDYVFSKTYTFNNFEVDEAKFVLEFLE